ncbi:unnamed protein product [Sphagnum jensenii]
MQLEPWPIIRVFKLLFTNFQYKPPFLMPNLETQNIRISETWTTFNSDNFGLDIYSLNHSSNTCGSGRARTNRTFLKTATGSVYNSVDDAVKGIEHKDALIAQLRQEVLAATKVDPLKKPVEQTEAPKRYIDNSKKYFEDIKAAKNEDELLRVQSQFVEESINDRLSPFAPLMAGLAKSQAVASVISEIPQFQEFYGSEDYRTTLESFPLLKQSIEISETYPERSGDLPQLYKMAAMAAAGRNLPKVVQGVAQTTPVQTRPTISSTPVTPAPRVNVAPPSLTSHAGRQTIIQQQEAVGVENLRF